VLLGFRELFVLQGDLARRPGSSAAGPDIDAAVEGLSSADRARLFAFLAALAVGGVWSFGSVSAVGYWFVTGRGPGGRLLASGSGSGGAVGRRGLRTLVAERRSAREAA
jgi:hypothetical protein